MPDALKGCQGAKSVQEVFVDNIYGALDDEDLRWRMTAAISSAHTVGMAHPENSGFDGHWSDMHNQGHFNNNYYKSLLFKGWVPETFEKFNAKNSFMH